MSNWHAENFLSKCINSKPKTDEHFIHVIAGVLTSLESLHPLEQQKVIQIHNRSLSMVSTA